MQVKTSVEVSTQIIEKRGLFYAQVFDIDTMNLIFETECTTMEGAATCIGNFISEILVKGFVATIHATTSKLRIK